MAWLGGAPARFGRGWPVGGIAQRTDLIPVDILKSVSDGYSIIRLVPPSNYGKARISILKPAMHDDLNIDLVFPIRDDVSAGLMCIKAELLYDAGIINARELNVVIGRAAAMTTADGRSACRQSAG